MPIDTQQLASIGDLGGFDPAGSQSKALSIKDMMDREQLSSLALREKKNDMATQTRIQDLLKGENVDYSSPEGVMRTAQKINQISPKAALEFQSTAQKYQSGQVDAQIQQYELLDHQQSLLVSQIDPIVSQARQMKAAGADDMTVNAFIAQNVPKALQNLQDTKLPNGQSALHPETLKAVSSAGPITLAKLESFESQSKAGQAAIKTRLDQYKADIQARGELNKEGDEKIRERSEDEKERHDRAMEAAAKAKSAGFTDTESNLLGALADKNVSLPAGLRSQAQIKATIDALIRNHPDMDADQIAEQIKSGKLKLAAETKASQTAGTQIGKVALAANELKTFGEQTLEASRELPRESQSLTINGLMQKGENELNDPKLLRLRTKLQALNNAYEQLSARGGTDKDKRAHIHELFDSRLTDANVQVLVKSLDEEAEGASQAANRTIAETSGSAIPGTGAAPAGGQGAGSAPSQVLRFDAQGNPIS